MTTTCRSLNATADLPDGIDHADNCNRVHCTFPAPLACPSNGCEHCDDGGYYDECPGPDNACIACSELVGSRVVCMRQPDSWVIGWDGNTREWFLVRESGDELSSHPTSKSAIIESQKTDPTVTVFYEMDGGGCLGDIGDDIWDWIA